MEPYCPCDFDFLDTDEFIQFVLEQKEQDWEEETKKEILTEDGLVRKDFEKFMKQAKGREMMKIGRNGSLELMRGGILGFQTKSFTEKSKVQRNLRKQSYVDLSCASAPSKSVRKIRKNLTQAKLKNRSNLSKRSWIDSFPTSSPSLPNQSYIKKKYITLSQTSFSPLKNPKPPKNPTKILSKYPSIPLPQLYNPYPKTSTKLIPQSQLNNDRIFDPAWISKSQRGADKSLFTTGHLRGKAKNYKNSSSNFT
ncbi:unnamed protein product [Moneuplotes crassus]|uniref:Uncharacterized protein n=1 Tax=Euplotes crassus TaxID=5936 RepID=A0AAD1XES6_EUPCR|nr:unnamed protein product [Moneuplotes crassus]